MEKNDTLGYFLKYKYWFDAVELLTYQVNERNKNKHFNTVDMIYLQKSMSFYTEISNEDFFNKHITNNFFYGFSQEYFIYEYPKSKTNFGLRRYNFFSLPMKLVHYSIGLYLIHLTSEIIDQYVKPNRKIKSFYGGDLRYGSNNKLHLKSKNIYYKHHYTEFKKEVTKSCKKSKNKIVLKLDVENYYENISIKKLLDFIYLKTKFITRDRMKFNINVIDMIELFYNYVSSNKDGVPQSGNDIISDYLGYIYLVFADMRIEKKLRESLNGLIKDYKIIRYVDDIYIVLEFVEHHKEADLKADAINFMSQISSLLYYEFGLRINDKSDLYYIHNEEERVNLLKGLKTVSQGYFISQSDDQNPVQDTVNKILIELQNIKNSTLDQLINKKQDEQTISTELFKSIYDKRVLQLFNKKENKEAVEHVFSNFNFDLIKVAPKELIVLILNNEEVKADFIDHLTNTDIISIIERDVILEFLCKTNFTEERLIQKLAQEVYFKDIIETFVSPIEDANYYGIKLEALDFFIDNHAIVKQIELRSLNEKFWNYSVALNHLLNEIHVICFEIKKNRDARTGLIKNFNANDVIKFLDEENIPTEIRMEIDNLFNRRNNNQISHPVIEGNWIGGVTKEEYMHYKKCVGECLRFLFRKNDMLSGISIYSAFTT